MLMPSITIKRIRGAAARHPRRTLGFTTSLCIFMALLSVLTLWQQWLNARDHAVETSLNVLAILQKDIERNIEIFDLSLQGAAAGVENPEVMRLPSRMRDLILFDTSTRASDLGSMFVLDKHGNLVIDALNDSPKQLNLGDRDFFKIHSRQTDRGLYISQPLDSRLVPGTRTVVLSRRITAPDGSFDGVVGIGIKLNYFQKIFASVKLQEHGSMSLINEQGAYLTRVPPIEKTVSSAAGIDPKFLQRLATSEQGTIKRNSTADGIQRLYIFRRLPALGMIVIVAPATEDILASWWSRAAVVTLLMIVFSAALHLVSLLLYVELRDRVVGEAAMRALARTDSLTGLATRRVFDETLRRESAIARRTGRPLTLIFVDVDHFKAYNDTYGHIAGDAALIKIAGIVAAGIRYGSDTAARYGGEEFVLVLADTPEKEAVLVAQRICEAVEKHAIPHAASELGCLTISLGVATFSGGAEDELEQLVAKADRSLYDAKQHGRNRVFSASYAA